MAEPRLFTIPAGIPFLPALADALVSGQLVDLGPEPESGLAAATIYLPTRRAGRALVQGKPFHELPNPVRTSF